ncbi:MULTISPECIES: CPBP family intramembrane glutamic endopeptidase [Planococcus]|uniref:CPBP family intramembrane metalloprotease n=1 Tax=Planococcus wigleyi TaxID=2762216 RepID=A0ABR8WGU5_9BACL|nr:MULTISPECIES: type II CAAX endopeptidase family protein [Planococcus]MBD8016276.1 CPBP family intramembrane metalloprotease [Planococcus wigleyi]
MPTKRKTFIDSFLKNGSSSRPKTKKNSSYRPKAQGTKTPLYVLLIFIAAQLSPILFISPTLNYFLDQGMDREAAGAATSGWLIFLTMGIGFILTLLIIFRDKRFFDIWKGTKSTVLMSVVWGFLGFLLLLIGQSVAALIEMKVLGIDPGSENTASLVYIAEAVPLAIVSIVLFGPILEELVFRRVLFGSLNQTTNFFFATAISALVFALIHFDFTHLLLYFTTGLILAFLYQKTKRIITPIIAHMCLNGYVMLIQLNMDKILEFQEQMEKLQTTGFSSFFQ